MYVPTMIFGHLLTSSNYNDEEAKVTGGRNGYGAKLCNIFSNKFTVETASREYQKAFKQVLFNLNKKCIFTIFFKCNFKICRLGQITWQNLLIQL
jgi:DNA gyrase/topoisomerase IV subunit B